MGQKVRNLLVVSVAIVLSLAVFLGVRTQTMTPSLTALAESSIPLDVALRNDKPTLIEFYANWCTTCQAMAGDTNQLRKDYGDEINFVMLNEDNSKWIPEMVSYRVDGIPHFAFLDGVGDLAATTIGEQPRAIMSENLNALIASNPLPHNQIIGQASEVEMTMTSSPDKSADPRSHGAQVVN